MSKGSKRTDKFKIFGIDPGSNIVGWAVVDYDNGNLSYHSAHAISLGKSKSYIARCNTLFENLYSVVYKHPDIKLVCLEDTFYDNFKQNKRAVITQGRTSGIALAAGAFAHINRELYPYIIPVKSIRKALGDPHMLKDQTRKVLSYVLQSKDVLDLSYDASDALAAATALGILYRGQFDDDS